MCTNGNVGEVEGKLGLEAKSLEGRRKEFKRLVVQIFEEQAQATQASGESGSEDESGDSDLADNDDEDGDSSDSDSPATRPKKSSAKPRKKRKSANNAKSVSKKRAVSSYMLWMNEVGRGQARAKNPGAAITDIAKIAGEMWRALPEATRTVRRLVLFFLALQWVLVLGQWPIIHFRVKSGDRSHPARCSKKHFAFV